MMLEDDQKLDESVKSYYSILNLCDGGYKLWTNPTEKYATSSAVCIKIYLEKILP
jgi:hypothetical protein